MAAYQEDFHEVLIGSLSNDDEEKRQLLQDLNTQSKRNVDLFRAKILPYSEVDLTDLLNGNFEF
jgi:hypothetical protein